MVTRAAVTKLQTSADNGQPPSDYVVPVIHIHLPESVVRVGFYGGLAAAAAAARWTCPWPCSSVWVWRSPVTGGVEDHPSQTKPRPSLCAHADVRQAFIQNLPAVSVQKSPGVHATSVPSTSPVTLYSDRRGPMEVFLERLLVELLAIAVQVVFWRLLEWFRTRSAASGQLVALPAA